MSTALICPGCRRLAASGDLYLRTLEPAGDELACECGCRYPIVDGVPIVLRDPAAFVANNGAAVTERDVTPEVAAELVAGTADEAPYTHLLDHVSIYLDAHWGDRAEPANGAFALAAFVDKLAALPHVRAAVELGCSVGRVTAELARRADHVVAFDLQFGAVRRARRLLAGERLAYARRSIGRHYAPASIAPGDRTADHVTLFCGDALDPPLVPRSYDRVVALNLLDSVPHPRQLLAVADGLCDRGGELILSSPYSWQSSVVAPSEWLGGADPAATLRAMLTGGEGLGRYQIVDEAELPWPVRRDARTVLAYQVHYLRARKL